METKKIKKSLKKEIKKAKFKKVDGIFKIIHMLAVVLWFLWLCYSSPKLIHMSQQELVFFVAGWTLVMTVIYFSINFIWWFFPASDRETKDLAREKIGEIDSKLLQLLEEEKEEIEEIKGNYNEEKESLEERISRLPEEEKEEIEETKKYYEEEKESLNERRGEITLYLQSQIKFCEKENDNSEYFL